MNAAQEIARELLLARLLVADRRPDRAAIQRQVGEVLGNGLSEAAVHSAVSAAWSVADRAGQITPAPPRLTEAGRAVAMSWLVTSSIPPRVRWATFRDRHLIARILTGSVDDRVVSKLARDPKGDTLRALALARHFHLNAVRVSNLGEVFAAILCAELDLGPADGVKFRSVPKPLVDRVIRKALRPTDTGKTALRKAIWRSWIAERLASPSAEASLDEFAADVLRSARERRTDVLGPNKALIHHVWHRLRNLPRWSGLEESTFRQMLIQCHLERKLRLVRADLVELLPADEARAAATPHGPIVYHFVAV